MSGVRTFLSSIRPDGFASALFLAMLAGLSAPARGEAAVLLARTTEIAIALLFFLHGAKLPTEAILGGLKNWRLQLFVLACTFALFPIIGMIVSEVGDGWFSPALLAGFVFLCILPSTVQSSVALTALSGASTAAAVCSAALSNIAGVVLTPLLAAALMGAHGLSLTWESVRAILMQLLAPFALGHASRFLLASLIEPRKKLLTWVDRGAILLVVYKAFSAAAVDNIWRRVGIGDVIAVLMIDALLLGVVLWIVRATARGLSLPRGDEATALFCGSQKSLATGAPVASILFSGANAGVILLPLMFYHQMQLITGAILARRYARDALSQ